MLTKYQRSVEVLDRPIPNERRLRARSIEFAGAISRDGVPRFKFDQPLIRPKLYTKQQLERLRSSEDIGLMKKAGTISLVGVGEVIEILRRSGLEPATSELARRTLEIARHAVCSLEDGSGWPIEEASLADVSVGRAKAGSSKRPIDIILDPRNGTLRDTRHQLLAGLGEAAEVDVTEFLEADKEFKIPIGSKFSEGVLLSPGATSTILSPSLVDVDQLYLTPFVADLGQALNIFQREHTGIDILAV